MVLGNAIGNAIVDQMKWNAKGEREAAARQVQEEQQRQAAEARRLENVWDERADDTLAEQDKIMAALPWRSGAAASAAGRAGNNGGAAGFGPVNMTGVPSVPGTSSGAAPSDTTAPSFLDSALKRIDEGARATSIFRYQSSEPTGNSLVDVVSSTNDLLNNTAARLLNLAMFTLNSVPIAWSALSDRSFEQASTDVLAATVSVPGGAGVGSALTTRRLFSGLGDDGVSVANSTVQVTEKGLARVESHLDAVLKHEDLPASFQAGERGMLERLRQGNLERQDVEFYMHELKESATFRTTGDLGAAHQRALQWRGATERDLFHPDVIKQHPELFNSSWR
jgi:hypothetical protein